MGFWRCLNPDEAVQEGALPLYEAHGTWTCRDCRRVFPADRLPPVMRWSWAPGPSSDVAAPGPADRWGRGRALCAQCAERPPEPGEQDTITGPHRVLRWTPDHP